MWELPEPSGFGDDELTGGVERQREAAVADADAHQP
jgi:hypothetical protein